MRNGLLYMPPNDPDPLPKIGMSGALTRLLPLRSNGPIENTASLRDDLTGLVGKGYTSLSDEAARGHFARMVSILGRDKAQQLFNHISIFNQNPNMGKLPITEKLSQFYDVGSDLPELDTLIKRAKMFGGGPISGLTDSPDLTSMQLSNRDIVKK